MSVTSVEVARDVAMTMGERMASREAIGDARLIARRRRGTGAARWRGDGLSADARASMQDGLR